MAGSQKVKKGGHKPNLAAKRQRERYASEHRRDKNKLKRVARSNGHEAAVLYAHQHLLSDWAKKAGII
jgi:hypothetical protein